MKCKKENNELKGNNTPNGVTTIACKQMKINNNQKENKLLEEKTITIKHHPKTTS